jgi:hypothetical protein
MSEYPKDIMEAAKQAERVLMRAPFPDGGWQSIAEAILAERERCAKIITDMAYQPPYSHRLLDVAEAIRGGN